MTATATTWSDLYRVASESLASRQEARWVIEEVSAAPWAWVNPGLGGVPSVPSAGMRLRFDELVSRRSAGEPIQYVLGHWGFRRLDLIVDRRVLIPRPETEVVVEVAVAELDRLAAGAPPDMSRTLDRSRRQLVVDLGAGSGAIALAMVSERSDVEVWATDLSHDALAVASANLARLGGLAATRMQLCHGSWWEALPPGLKGRVDLAVSNPPYVSSGEMERLPDEVMAWEPRLALDAGPTGLEAVEAILEEAPDWLASRGTAVVEIAPHQSGPAVAIARRTGFAQVEVRPDLANRDRVLVARLEP